MWLICVVDTPGGGLHRADLPKPGLALFEVSWPRRAKAKLTDPTAMVVGTVDADGQPWQHTVLLKTTAMPGHEEVFLPHQHGQPRRASWEDNPRIPACFPWHTPWTARCVTGRVEKLGTLGVMKYFHSRPGTAQIAAWVCQSTHLGPWRAGGQVPRTQSRITQGEVPLPSFWGGFRVRIDTVEFWQGRASPAIASTTPERGTAGIERLAPDEPSRRALLQGRFVYLVSAVERRIDERRSVMVTVFFPVSTSCCRRRGMDLLIEGSGASWQAVAGLAAAGEPLRWLLLGKAEMAPWAACPPGRQPLGQQPARRLARGGRMPPLADRGAEPADPDRRLPAPCVSWRSEGRPDRPGTQGADQTLGADEDHSQRAPKHLLARRLTTPVLRETGGRDALVLRPSPADEQHHQHYCSDGRSPATPSTSPS